jgi:glycosyltransferase involved in cell wall biosynthesis
MVLDITKKPLRIALVTDWLKDWGGAEQVLYDLLEIYPNAEIFTSIFEPSRLLVENYAPYATPEFPTLKGRVRRSFLDRIPFVRTHPKMFPFLRPYAFEMLDFRGFDIVISSSSAESKGIIVPQNTLHVCYCHTPTRYYWSHTHEYMESSEFGILSFFARWVMPYFFHSLRLWDQLAAIRVDRFIANSRNTATRISKYYRRSSTIITPGIADEQFTIAHKVLSENTPFVAIGRVIPLKRFDIIIEAFNQNGLPLVILTNTEGSFVQSLRDRSNSNITWIFQATNEQKVVQLQWARALIFPSEDDFGMVPIEAMLCGTPVIAYAWGGALETVEPDVSGIFFDEQTPESLARVIAVFDPSKFSQEKVRAHGLKFTKKVFQQKVSDFIQKEFELFKKNPTMFHVEN